jgi:hypothetical protein
MNSTRRKRFVYTFIVAMALPMTACVSFMDVRAEQAVLDALPRIVGPGDYVVDVTGVETSAGEIVDIERVHAVGKRVAHSQSPVLDRVEVNLASVRVNQKKETFEGLKDANAKVWVKAADVAAFLERSPYLEGVVVMFEALDKVLLHARPVIPGISLSPATVVKLRGRLVRRGSELRLKIADMRMGTLISGVLPAHMLEQAINPLVDLSVLPALARISGMRIKGNALTVNARVRQVDVDSHVKYSDHIAGEHSQRAM